MSKYTDLYHFLAKKDVPSEKVLFHPILMQFASRLNGCTYTEFMTDYRILVESNIKCLEKVEHDAVGLISDPYRETSAFGASIEFSGDRSPYCESFVNTINDIEKIVNPNVYIAERTRDRIEAVQYYQSLIGNDIPIIGWIEGPMAEAADLAGMNSLLTKLLIEPDFIIKLMDVCMITAKDFARAQVEAGCLVIGIGDAVCSQIDAHMYRTFVQELHIDLIEYIHSLGGFTKLHICGNITHLLEALSETGTDILDLDWMVDVEHAREKVGNEMILCGNLDPVQSIQKKEPHEIIFEAQQLMEKQKGQRFILSGGCEITPETPLENLIAFRKSTELK